MEDYVPQALQEMTPASQQRLVVGISLTMIYLLGAWLNTHVRNVTH